MSEPGIQYWLGLTRVQGLGTRGAQKLAAHFGSAQAAYEASLYDLQAAGLGEHLARAIADGEGRREAEQEIDRAAAAGYRLLACSEAEYPRLLKEIPDPPLVLYIQGNAECLSRYAIAVVGTRRPTAYGSSVAHRLGHDLAQRQLAVVSGLARGIDSAAHRGALEAGGVTIAVLGSGLDVIYPRENKKLAEGIAVTGAIISEFPLGTSPAPENFPIRNRVISGLALGTLIVEAAEYSGSLITARLALEQNREVYAVPGNITSPQSFGPNVLIKQGAKLVDRWLDVVEELPAAIRSELLPAPVATGEETTPERAKLFEASLGADQKTVYDALRADEPMFVDAVCDAVSLPQPRILAALLQLEMSGLVRQLPGKNFIRKL